MRSKVLDYVSYDEVIFPDGYLDISILSWDSVEKVYIKDLQELYFKATGQFLKYSELDDSFIYERLGFPQIHNLEDFKKFARYDYMQHRISDKYYQSIRPYLLAFHAETAQVLVNQDEYLLYEKEYMSEMEQFAENSDESIQSYAKEYLGLRGDVMHHIKEQAYEEFVFLLIANHRFAEALENFDDLDYDSYIQKKSLEGYDSVTLSYDLPFDFFKKHYSEILFNDELFEYFSKKINFITRS